VRAIHARDFQAIFHITETFSHAHVLLFTDTAEKVYQSCAQLSKSHGRNLFKKIWQSRNKNKSNNIHNKGKAKSHVT